MNQLSSNNTILRVSVPPQYFSDDNVRKLNWSISFAFMIPLGWGVFVFGMSAALVIAVCVAGALLTELFCSRMFRKASIGDGQAFQIGLLLAILMPPGVALHVPLIAAIAAVASKWVFGGTASGLFNPVCFAWGIVFLAWPDLMTAFVNPFDHSLVQDSFTLTRQYLVSGNVVLANPMDMIQGISTALPSALDLQVSSALNSGVFQTFATVLPPGYVDPIVGFGVQTVGGASGLILMLVSIWLMYRELSGWQAPLGMFFSAFLIIYLFGGLPFGMGFARGDVLFFVFKSTFLTVMFLLAGVYGLAPFNARGQLVFGLLTGTISAILLIFGLNMFAPLGAFFVSGLTVWVIERTFRNRSRFATKLVNQ